METFIFGFKLSFIIIHLFFLICVKGEILEPFEILKSNEKYKFIFKKLTKIADLLRFWITWEMFTRSDKTFFDIKITAETASGKKDIWHLRKDKEIGLIKINSFRTNISLTFRYPIITKYFINDYLVESLKEFYKNKNEIFLYLKIEKVDYSSYEDDYIINNRLKPLKFEILFEWFGVHNVNTGYL